MKKLISSKVRQRVTNGFVAVLSSLAMVGGNVSVLPIEPVHAAEETNIMPDRLYTWGQDGIDEDYAYGEMNFKNAKFGNGFTFDGKNIYEANNTEFDENHTMFASQAFKCKGKIYDVKIYFKKNATTPNVNYIVNHDAGSKIISLGGVGTGKEKNINTRVTTQWHFYETGTNNEASVKGLFYLDDIDGAPESQWQNGQADIYDMGVEGYVFHSGLKKVYATGDTTVHIAKSNMTYTANKQTQQIPQGMIYGTKHCTPGENDTRQAIWVLFDSTPNAPLTFEHFTGKGWGSNLGDTPLLAVNYQITKSSKYKPNTLVKTDYIKQYADQYDVQNYQENVPGYVFDGWYEDEACTKKIVALKNISSNHTVYGKYKLDTFMLDERPTHAIIDDGGSPEVPAGQDKTITWKPEDGFHIDKVLIDGKEIPVQDVNQGSYTFEKMDSNHTIEVVGKENYKINTSINNGTITQSITDIEPNGKRTVEWKADDGCHITSVIIDGKEQKIDDKQKGSYTFDNINEDHTVIVKAEKDTPKPQAPTTNDGVHTGVDGTTTQYAAFGVPSVAAGLIALLKLKKKVE